MKVRCGIMTAEDLRNGLANVSSFIEKLIKVFTDLYNFRKEQMESFQK